MTMSKQELIEAAYEMTGGNIKDLSTDQLRRLMTITQFVTDLCLNEIEDRGELTFLQGSPIVPYQCEHAVETILTRGREDSLIGVNPETRQSFPIKLDEGRVIEVEEDDDDDKDRPDFGVRAAYVELLRVLFARNAITSDEIGSIIAMLTELSAAYETKPTQRASIETFSKTLMRLRPDRTSGGSATQ